MGLALCESTIKRALSPTATNRHLLSQIRSPNAEYVQTCFYQRLNKSKLVFAAEMTLDVGTA